MDFLRFRLCPGPSYLNECIILFRKTSVSDKALCDTVSVVLSDWPHTVSMFPYKRAINVNAEKSLAVNSKQSILGNWPPV